jgi:hypothetical protein
MYETAGRGGPATFDLVFAGRQWTGGFRPSEIKTLRYDRVTGDFQEVNLLEEVGQALSPAHPEPRR